jgi:hypothetical protein
MLKDTDAPVGSEAESTKPNASNASSNFHQAATQAQDHQLMVSAPLIAVARTPNTLFVVSPDLDDETLFAYASESLALASVMAGEFAGMLNGTQRNKMLAIQQVILLGELALNRRLDATI